MEEILLEIRGIASILKSLGYVEDDVCDMGYAMDFLSAKLFECATKMSDELAKIKNTT